MSSFLVIFIFSCFLQNRINAQDFLDSNRNDFDPDKKFRWTDPDQKTIRSLVEVEPDLENLKGTIRYDAYTTIQVRILYDKKKKMMAYKDLVNEVCLLEKISGSKKPLIYKLPGKKEEEMQEKEHDKVPKMFFLSKIVLKRKKVRKFAGKRIMTFCDGLKTGFLKEIPFAHNELPESEERKNEKRKLREQFFEFLHRNPKGKNNREKRQIRNRFRGQTQTQFLSFGDGKGNAEAVAQPEISKTIISGVNGIGQAQSQSGGADCDGCYPGEGGSRFGTGFRTGIGRETGRPESETAGAGRPGISDSRRGSEGTLPDGSRGTPGYRGGDGAVVTGGAGVPGMPGSRGETGGPGGRTGGAGLPGKTGGPGGGVGGPGYTGTTGGRGDADQPGVGGTGYPGTPGGRRDEGRPGSGLNGHGYPGTTGGRGDIGGPGGGDGGGYPGKPGYIGPGVGTGSLGTGVRDSSGRPGQGGPGLGGNGFPGQSHGRPGEVPGTNGHSKPYYPNGAGHTQPGGGAGTTGGVGAQLGGNGARYPPSASSKPFYPGGEAPGHGTPGGAGKHPVENGARYPPSASSKPFYPGGEAPGHGAGTPGGAGTHPSARYPPSASSKPYYPNGQLQPGVSGTPGARYPPSASSKPYPPSGGSRPAGPGQISPGMTNGQIPGRYPPSASSKPYYPGASRPGGAYPPSASSKPFYPPGTGGQYTPGANGQIPPRYPPSASSKPYGPKNGHLPPSSGNGLQPPARYPPSSSSKLYPPSGGGSYVPGRNGHSGATNGHGQVKPSIPSVPPSAGSKPLHPNQGQWNGQRPDQSGFQPGRYPPSASSKPYYPPSSHSQPQPQPQPQPHFQQQPVRPPYPDGPGQIRPNIIFRQHGGPSQTSIDQYGGQEVPCESELPDGTNGIGGYPGMGRPGEGGHISGVDHGKPEGNGYGQYPRPGVHGGTHPGVHSGSTYPGGHQGPSSSGYPTAHPGGHQGPSASGHPGSHQEGSVPGQHGMHPGAIHPGEHQGPSGSSQPGSGYPGTYQGSTGSGQPGAHTGAAYPGGHQGPSGSGQPGVHPSRTYPGGHQGPSGSGQPGVHPGAIYPGGHPGTSHQPGVHGGSGSAGYPGVSGSGYPGTHQGSGQPGVHPDGTYPGSHQGPGGAGYPGTHPGAHLGPSGVGQGGAGHPSTYPGAGGTGQPGVGGAGYPDHSGRPETGQPSQAGAGYPGTDGAGQLGPGGTGRPGYYPGGLPGSQDGGQIPGGSQTLTPGAGGRPDIVQPGTSGTRPGGGDQTTGQRPGWGEGGTGTSQGGTGDGRIGGGGAVGGARGSGSQTGGGGAEAGESGTDICKLGTECKSGEDSQVQTTVTQDGNATRALSSAQGRFNTGIAQAQVSGVYTGSGSFSAQAQTSDNDKGAQVQVIGGSRGASSSAQGMGGRGQTQAQVQLGSQNGATSAEAQSGGSNFGTNTQVQAGAQGGLADAQADGPGGTSSQAQIGFTPYTNKTDKEKDQKVPFQGGVSASAQSGANVGQSQTELFGSFYKGISYTGSAQAGSGRGHNKLRNSNSSAVNGTENEKQSMTQIGFMNKNGLLPLPKFGQGILKDINIHEPVDQESPSKKSNESGEIPDLVKEKPDREELEPVTSAPVPKTGGNYAKDKTNPRIDKDAEILETKDKEDDDDEYDEEEEEYDELEDLKKARPIKYKQGEGIETKYGSVIEKDQSITVKQKSPTQAQTVFIGGLDKKHDVHIEQDADEQVKEGDILQPGDRILGEDGFTIPEGYRGKVTSVAGQIGKTRAQAPDFGRAQSQTVLVKPGTGRVHYTNPRPYRGDQLRYAPHLGKYISNVDDPAGKISNGIDNIYQPPYASSSIINNGKKSYSNIYQSRSSGCGYYTFSCDVVFGSNGRAKICKPNPPTNPDGTPCVI